LVFLILTGINANPRGKSLHNLDVVAAGVFRREETEERPRRAGHVLYRAVESSAKAVYVEVDGFTGAHAAELRLLEVRGDPDVVDGNNREQRLAGLDSISDLDCLVSDNAADRSVNCGVAQVEFRNAYIGASLFKCADGRVGFCAGVGDLLWSSLCGGNFRLALRYSTFGFGNLACRRGLCSLIRSKSICCSLRLGFTRVVE
jgi:hypothetical protein